jgi:phosphoribosylformimino-5-aminoimidazole carboxamide ribotide isomerase
MEIIPAIDLRGGKCVRLLQGSEDNVTEYSEDPAAVAEMWVKQGATRLHIVNLDGAFGRVSRNLDVVREIAREVNAVVQLGGGLRSMADIESAFGIGCAKIVLGTAAVENTGALTSALARYGQDRVLVAIDAMNGMVAARGWKSVSNTRVLEFAEGIQRLGVTEVVYTDIARDGTLLGLDISAVKELARRGLHIIASGGISSHEDVLALAALHDPGITGVIIGKALYEKRIDLPRLLGEVSTC